MSDDMKRYRAILQETVKSITENNAQLTDYISATGNDLFLDIPVNQDWKTSGQGHWSSVQKAVRVTSIKLSMELGEELFVGDVQVYFDTNTWDVETDGLIYTDPQFEKHFQLFLSKFSIPATAIRNIDYSEQGMQGDDYVSFDAFELGNYILYQAIIGDPTTVNQRKTAIITTLLKFIKTDEQDIVVAEIVKQLTNLKVNWPELAVISRSLNAKLGK